jgi:hypothetical protein
MFAILVLMSVMVCVRAFEKKNVIEMVTECTAGQVSGNREIMEVSHATI